MANTSWGHSPGFTGSLSRNTDQGHLTILWQMPDTAPSEKNILYELQMDLSPDFPSPQTRYLGPDRGFFTSGLEEGSYYFRVRSLTSINEIQTPGDWSPLLSVTVRYPEFSRVLALLILGASLLIALLSVVLYGHFKVYLPSQPRPDPS